MKQTIYLETTVPSYYVSRSSRDVVVLAHQEITRVWWESRLPLFDVYVSPVVLQEAAQGDSDQAHKRLEVLSAFAVLDATNEVEQLATTYMEQIGLPSKAIRDAAHLAFACHAGVDYLVTWNCAHIANAEFRRRLWGINARIEVQTPIICTPEELMGTEV